MKTSSEPIKQKKKTAKTASAASRKPDKVEPSVTVLQAGKCPSLTNKSTLTYNIGVDDEGRACIRVNGNSGGGFFSKEWVAQETIESVLGAIPEDHPISSFNLEPMFANHSANNPGFMAAVLLKEGLLARQPGKKRHFAFTGTEAFLAKVDKLKASKKAK